MPRAFIAIIICLGLQSLIGNVSARPTFGAISFPNILAVNASASASASASANATAQSNLAVGAHANATAGTSLGKAGTLTMPGLAPQGKTCTCQESTSTPSLSDTTPPPPPPPPVQSGADAKPNDTAPPTDLKATSPDTTNSTGSGSNPPPAGNTSASETPSPTSGASNLSASDFARAVPMAMSVFAAIAFLYI